MVDCQQLARHAAPDPQQPRTILQLEEERSQSPNTDADEHKRDRVPHEQGKTSHEQDQVPHAGGRAGFGSGGRVEGLTSVCARVLAGEVARCTHCRV